MEKTRTVAAGRTPVVERRPVVDALRFFEAEEKGCDENKRRAAVRPRAFPYFEDVSALRATASLHHAFFESGPSPKGFQKDHLTPARMDQRDSPKVSRSCSWELELPVMLAW